MKKIFPVYDIGTLSDFKQEDILISRFAPYLAIHKNLHLPHKHNFYHLLLFTEGSGSHAIDFVNFAVKPYQVYFMSPGQVHGWSFEGKVDGYVINFSPAFFQSFLLRPDYVEQLAFFGGEVNNSVIDLPDELHSTVKEIMEQVVAESEQNKALALDMVKALLLQFFITVNRVAAAHLPAVTPHNYLLFKNFQQLVEKNFNTLRLPRDYAALLYVTPNHLNALCNDVVGIPAGDLIRNRVVLEAKRLLVNFDLNINEISDRLNFTDNSYFSRFFKKQEGITPEEFRKKLKIKTS